MITFTGEQKRVEQFYDETAEREWDRMDRNPLEFAMTKRAIEEYGIQGQVDILDVGGGPGRYAIWLAELGHEVTLLDLSNENLLLAKQKAAEAGVELAEFVQGSATQLEQINDQWFDVVLLLGPLYHLRDVNERKQAISEARRVLKPGGIIFAAFLNRYGLVRYVAKEECDLLGDEPEFIKSLLESGCPRSQKYPTAFSSTSYWSYPSEIEPLMSECGFEKLALINVEGAFAYIDDALKELPADQWEKWIDMNYKFGKLSELHAAGIHLVYVGR